MVSNFANYLPRLCLCQGGSAPAPLGISWPQESHGPDGPWHAVQISLGKPPQQLALYPGGSWGSRILLISNCQNTSLSSTCYTTRQQGRSISLSLIRNDGTVLPIGVAERLPLYGTAYHALDQMDVEGKVSPNVSLQALSNVYHKYPGGKFSPVQVGVLSLGSPDINQTFNIYEANDSAIQATFSPSYLYTHDLIPSYSYGMHIGSVALGISGSLQLGGYDKNRGSSPWSYVHMPGLLSHGNSSIFYSITAHISGADPYMYLPQSTCDAIAAQLPVTYQPDYGLYFWNTNNTIVGSPAYLEFIFSKDSRNNANLTIKVPFRLLNLTLEPPLVDKPTPYFPCMGTNGTYVLGRAFMQAAFVGVHWSLRNWFLAQAPGPNKPGPPWVLTINPDNTKIYGSDSEWVNSWKGHWTELPINSTTPYVHDPDPVQGLSYGAKAGIGIGVALGALLAIAPVAVWLMRRRKKAGASEPAPDLVYTAAHTN
ncbi:aspartic peptidase domain-containing protein [Aspergillus avenaceus]|uniref:Aspartic peptidase domain-containing protein n=1 Tax=Aspergillus avenaceus TaxID=36643 RepID=A0A5N6TZQ7_ASPAV|nr:aspartic peptidase domain-containing protein [Aspergillus avenaceus]